MRSPFPLILVISVAIAAGGFFCPVFFCPADGQEFDYRRVTLKSVEPSHDGAGHWTLKVTGEYPRVPIGTKLRFDLTWRAALVESFKITVEEKVFSQKFKLVRSALIIDSEIRIRTTIKRSEQSKKILETMAQDLQAFPPGQSSWTDHHPTQGFKIGTAADREKLLTKIHEFFWSRLRELVKLDRTIEDQVEKFRAKENLDSKKWHAWFGSKVVEKLVEFQKGIEEQYEELTYQNVRVSLNDLEELSRAVARRALWRQETLFKGFNVELPEQYREFEGLQTNTSTRQVPGKSYLSSVGARICKDIGFTPPKKGSLSPKAGSNGDTENSKTGNSKTGNSKTGNSDDPGSSNKEKHP